MALIQKQLNGKYVQCNIELKGTMVCECRTGHCSALCAGITIRKYRLHVPLMLDILHRWDGSNKIGFCMYIDIYGKWGESS